MTLVKKIDLMHGKFGKIEKKCKDCEHLHYNHWNGKNYYKCEIYGQSDSEATDWRLSYQACGLFNKPYGKSELYKDKLEVKENIDGQMKLGD